MLCNPNVYYRVNRSPLLVLLSLMKPVQIFPSCFNIDAEVFPTVIFMHFSPMRATCPPSFYHFSKIRRRVQITRCNYFSVFQFWLKSGSNVDALREDLYARLCVLLITYRSNSCGEIRNTFYIYSFLVSKYGFRDKEQRVCHFCARRDGFSTAPC
jgi:hypothetical protein